MEQAILLQTNRHERIEKAIDNFERGIKTSLPYLETRLETLEKEWQAFKATHDQIISVKITKEQKENLPYFTVDLYNTVEENYILCKSKLKHAIQKLTPKHEPGVASASSSSKTNYADIKMPRLNLPTFSGRYTEWQSFHDMFLLIHNNANYENVQKFHLLKSSLAGEAEQLVRSITVTNDNYLQAWDTLKKRYSNKRYISNCIFKRLFGLRALSNESSSHIKQLLDTTVECLHSLKNLGLPTDEWDAIAVYMTVSKLDPESHRLWEQQTSAETKDELPSFKTLTEFLEMRFRSLEMIEPSSRPAVRPKAFHASLETTKCAVCDENHYIYQCKQFAKKDCNERYEFVQKAGLCFNCLTPYHSANKCLRNTSCRICHKRHHSLLHPEKRTHDAGNTVLDAEKHKDSRETKNNIVSHHATNQPGQNILLATALVGVESRIGKTHIFRALIDQGSQASFVTEEFVQMLGLKRIKINGVVSGLSEGQQLCTKYMVEFEMKSRHDSTFTVQVQAYVLKTLTSYLPSQEVTLSNWPELEEMTLADPGYYIPNTIDMLLGAEVYSKIIDTGLKKSPSGVLAQYTHLGWILSGDTTETKTNENKYNKTIISMHVCVCENDQLKKFWELHDDHQTTERKKTKDEETCEEIYKKTTTRNENGRYIVNLPFKDEKQSPAQQCGETKQMAVSRFLQLERKLKTNPKLKTEYKEVIDEYLQLGHMTLAEDNEENAVYLPHHAIVREDKVTTKVRVVFDASAKGSKGVSLNDTLLVGPTLQETLRDLIIKWRTYPIVLVADVVKMYRQVLVDPQHADYQRIVWRDDPEKELKNYKLLTVTFGTASAPYLAVRTLIQIAEDEGHKYPVAAEVVKKAFYVDDLMTGCNNLNEAKTIYKQTTELLELGGFKLQKWSSNSHEFLKEINNNKDNKTKDNFEIKLDEVMKILGLKWNRHDDVFNFSVDLPPINHPITKRKILSDVARLFDPFGWLAPAIVIAKIFIQQLWLCNCGWDEQLPPELIKEWLSYRNDLIHLENIQLDRWFGNSPNNETVEIHGFADSSIRAYGAVVYLRVVGNKNIRINIIASKTKVAPIKQISVPRLELCAAQLLATMLAETAQTLKISMNNVFAYTDSTVVLAWLTAGPTRWQTFVANRVSVIQKCLPNDRWQHVASAENPADIASRGMKPSLLANTPMWWSGPQWLSQKHTQKDKKPIPKTNLEEKKNTSLTFHCETNERPIWERFSSLHRMIRVLSYCRRLLRHKERNDFTDYLTATETKETLNKCIKMSQKIHFEEELQDLKTKERVKKRSDLISLSPYINTDGLLRVGGRIQGAKLPQEFKHPIIIPKQSFLTKLIIRDAHSNLLHGGNRLMMNYLRSKYWICGLKPLVKQCIRECVVCVRYKAVTNQQIMGEIPSVRLNPGRPFETSGVDYAGPIQMRTSKGRGQKSYKGYICLFVCMKTRAVHLEAVSDLTAQGFMAAFRRFVARRGRCTDMWSDNGLNFVGAAKELKKLHTECKTQLEKEIAELVSNDGTTWHFIPPRAPNFGGLWESGVRSVKTHLTKILGNSTLTFEEMATLLSQIEACLNSRPIGQLNDHPDDLTPLTPAHFLVGESLMVVPDKTHDNQVINHLDRWRLVQRMTQHFWQRWSKEFLHTMQHRYKWQTKSSHPNLGDLVIVKDEDLPPAKWLLARVTELHYGKDNEVRVVSLKRKDAILKRPLSKLILLPVNDEKTNDEKANDD